MDPFAGNNQDPQSLHKYLYVHNNPVMNIDPSGNMTLAGGLAVTGIIALTISIILPAMHGAGFANLPFLGHRPKVVRPICNFSAAWVPV